MLARFPAGQARVLSIGAGPYTHGSTLVCGMVISNGEMLPFASVFTATDPVERNSVVVAKVGEHTPASAQQLQGWSDIALMFCRDNGLASVVD